MAILSVSILLVRMIPKGKRLKNVIFFQPGRHVPLKYKGAGHMATKCDSKTEVYSRVCGFFRPVQQWNKGKKEEFKDRSEFVMGKTEETK